MTTLTMASASDRERDEWSAIGDDLALLARLHDREVDVDLIQALRAAPVAEWFALTLSGDTFARGVEFVNEALSLAPDPMTDAALDAMAAEYAAIYLNHTYRISPSESFWVGDDGLERQEAMFAVRRDYARLGFRAPDWRKRADDHIAHELAFMAQVAPYLGDKVVAKAMAQFMREHSLVWIPAFAGRVARRCLSPFYAGIALLTVAYLECLAAVLRDCQGLDLQPISPPRPKQAPAEGLTCGDPPPRYSPGAGPGW